jgi:hypothetical protein
MTRRILVTAGRLFDAIETRWESSRSQRHLASLLIVVFLLALALIEARRQGWLPQHLAERLSTSHFQALHAVFTLLLVMEVVSLVLGLSRSVANAAGKQFEIMSLILIRQSFKELSDLPEPIEASQVLDVIPLIISDALGALLIFAALGVYYRLQRHRPITEDVDKRASFVASKKLIGLILLTALVALAVRVVWRTAAGLPSDFFASFYTVLIFADVLIVLISMRYSSAYHVVFRYFGFAVATVLIRLALTAPRIWDASLGLGATLFAVALTWVYNRAADDLEAVNVCPPE